MASIGGTDLGSVTSERQSKVAQLFQQPLPTQNSDKAILLDIFGLRRNITLNGEFVGTLVEQNTFIQAIETIQNGTQEGATFVSSHTSTPNKVVFIDSFEWDVQKGTPTKIGYMLTLIEGASTA
jgi:hypothetical protein